MDEAAARLRLKPGMGIADARAMYPAIEIVAADAEADRRLLEALADWCDRYTPLVALDGADGLFLDITGCAHLFGGEEALVDALLGRCLEQGFRARAGLASTPGAAWAAARFSSGHAVLDDGCEKSFFVDLPLAALRLEEGTISRLEGVGLRTSGAVMSAPRAPLARRFGAMLLLRVDQALGEIDEVISPRRPIAPFSVERHLAEPVGLIEDIERLVLVLAGSLKQDLERRGEGARLFELLLFRVDGAVSRISASASLPMRDPVAIGRLFRERLAALGEALEPGYGFDLVRLAAGATASLDTPQADLGGEDRTDSEDIALFADRVRARLGREAMLSPLLVESHLPERAASLVPADSGPPERRAPVLPRGEADVLPSRRAPERPLRLFRRPEPIDVPATDVPEGPPLNFRWRRAMHRVLRAEGPERIAPEWWREDKGAPTRDYFRVEDNRGHRYWLFREGLYDGAGVSPRWYLQGISA